MHRKCWYPFVLLILCLLPGERLQAGGINQNNIAIVINTQDHLSKKIAEYYIDKRQIPQKHIIRLSFPKKAVLTRKEWKKIKLQLTKQTPENIQAYALTWILPYKVDCMSITTAFSDDLDPAYCAKGCKLTKQSQYFYSNSSHPYRDFKIRPTMVLAARNFQDARTLIDRGVASDNTHPVGTAYLVSTDDKARNVRAVLYNKVKSFFSSFFRVELLKMDRLRDKSDIMFYFTGLRDVPDIDKNTYLPGAIADHLTSAGGQLTGGRQMSALKWLEAGATGSFGTVAEPCNFLQKFPNPGVLMHRYLQGDSLIEAYWKSVQQPGQGLFIGEPLASPFSRL